MLKDSTDKAKQKFLLYILDDMLEYLDADFLGAENYHKIILHVAGKASSPSPAIRQAAVYGIGMAAQHGGQGFTPVYDACLAAIKAAIEFKADAAVAEKKKKLYKFHHARDNSVAALGRILKHQSSNAATANLYGTWVELLPLTHDMIESKEQN